MRRGFFALLLMLGLFPSAVKAQQAADTAKADAMLHEYVAALTGEPVPVKNSECDNMIVSCSDPAVRQYVTLKLYGHYAESPVMGDEAVAVHIADRWILSGEVPVREAMDLTYIRIFTEFNRSSLIGMPAPCLELKNPEGETERLFDGHDSGKCRILYFYSPDCAVCTLLTAQLKALLESRNDPVEVIAVYTGQDAEAWREYRTRRLNIYASRVEVRHFWDPEIDSDYQRKYGVITTPMLLLTDPAGTIAGRKLDAGALSVLLKRMLDEQPYDYGSAASKEMFQQVFPAEVTAEAVRETAAYIVSQTLEAGDTAGFKHLTGDLLYYLAGEKGEGSKIGMEQLIDAYILNNNGIWTTADDTLKVVGLAGMLKSLLMLSPAGSAVPDLKVPGVLRRRGTSAAGLYPLRYIRGNPALIVFYAPGCARCKETLAAVDALVQDRRHRNLKVLLVDMDEVCGRNETLSGELLRHFDLSVLPFVIEVDYSGTVQRRYIDVTRY